MIILVIPAYNEEPSVGLVVNQVKNLVDRVIVVDDGSTDRTSMVAKAAGAEVIRHIVNRDYGAALQTGHQLALVLGADYIIHYDADGQFVAQDIVKVLEPLQRGDVQVVLGSRFLGQAEHIPLFRKLILKMGIIFTWFFSGIKLTDSQNGFRGFTAAAAQKINIRQDGKAATSEIIDEIARLDLKYLEVPVIVHYTAYSLNKNKANTIFDVWRIVRDLLLAKLIK